MPSAKGDGVEETERDVGEKKGRSPGRREKERMIRDRTLTEWEWKGKWRNENEKGTRTQGAPVR